MAGRNSLSELSEGASWDLVRRAREVSVAAVVEGRPLFRTMHAAVVGHTLVLHGAPKGEKASWVGAPVVACAQEVVARVPSYLRHPDKACPATTYYRSVEVHGRIEVLSEPTRKADALQRLMETLQPEGGYRPVRADDPLYRTVVEGLAMWCIVPERVSGVEKLGQHVREPEMSRILEGLWRRGDPGDLAGIEVLRDAHPGAPAFTSLPDGLVARCAPRAGELEAPLRWLQDAYWNQGMTMDTLRGAHQHSAWVGIEREGHLVASARAISDHHKRAWVYDVVVDPAQQRAGLGSHLMRILLDHPHVRHVRTVNLVTRDADPFYVRLGFHTQTGWGEGDARRVVMTRAS